MPADGREAARRIVEEVFGGSGPVEVDDGPARDGPAASSVTVSEEPEASPARLRARELVAEIFEPVQVGDVAPVSSPAVQRSHPDGAGPTPPQPSTSEVPSAAQRAGRRIVAEAEVAQQARAAAAAAEQAAAERAGKEAEAAARAAALRDEEEAETAAHGERALRARREWLAGATAEVPSEATAEAPSDGPPAPEAEEALFVPPGADPSTPDEGDVLFDVLPPEDPGLPPSSAVDVAGPPPPPVPVLVSDPPRDPVALALTEDPELPADLPQDPPALALPEDPAAPQLAARLVSEVLEERGDEQRHAAGAVPEPNATTDTGTRALRAGRWVLVTVIAAVTLALLFPLAVRAVLELVSLS